VYVQLRLEAHSDCSWVHEALVRATSTHPRAKAGAQPIAARLEFALEAAREEVSQLQKLTWPVPAIGRFGQRKLHLPELQSRHGWKEDLRERLAG